MNKIVLVTGATGYIGSWVTKYLLEKNYTVRIAVRSKTNTKKYQHLLDIAEKTNGKLEVFEADLLKENSYDEAASGADAVIHIASPFTLRFKDAQRDLIEPAIKGTRNVLSAATKSGTVKRIVLTSSVAAIYGDNVDMRNQGLNEFTEEHFNTTSSATHQPYSFSKVSAEKEAWKISKEQNQWKLVVINPSFVMGPSLANTSDSESLNFVKEILKGKLFFGAPDLTFGFVDVRDVALAHVLALENENAEGRHILSKSEMNVMELSKVIGKNFKGKYRLPLMMAPKPILYLVGGLFGVTPKFVKLNVGYPLKLNSTKSRESLGLKYTDFDETVVDMVNQMHELGIV
ncbi:MAG TPA: aldehyde reductase [Tenuifilaceae bacterium]|nr:aldehyde reductase [Tenuifilaceae bacterium]